MSDYIKREDAIKAMCSMCPTNKFIHGTCQYLLNGECAEINDLKTIPFADVVERSEHEEKVNEIIFAHKDWKPIKRGEWISDGVAGFKCCSCNEWSPYFSDFCPNCGARMKGADDE